MTQRIVNTQTGEVTTDNTPLPSFAPVLSLAEEKTEASIYIDGKMDVVRRSFMTEITGQQITYTEKEKEAVAFLAEDPAPVDLTPYPYIAAEIALTGETATNTATAYQTMATQLRTVGPPLEALRVASKAAVNAATDSAGVLAAKTAFDTGLAGLI